jgi:hypothetical protein
MIHHDDSRPPTNDVRTMQSSPFSADPSDSFGNQTVRSDSSELVPLRRR